LSELEESIQARTGIHDESHAGAQRAVEHPFRNFDAVVTLAFVDLADQHAAVRLRRASYYQLLVEKRVPAVAHATSLCIVGIAFGLCTTSGALTWASTA
jgi:hypothetical protein